MFSNNLVEPYYNVEFIYDCISLLYNTTIKFKFKRYENHLPYETPDCANIEME